MFPKMRGGGAFADATAFRIACGAIILLGIGMLFMCAQVESLAARIKRLEGRPTPAAVESP